MASNVFDTPLGYVGVAAGERGVTCVVLPWPDAADTVRRLEEHVAEVARRAARPRRSGRGAGDTPGHAEGHAPGQAPGQAPGHASPEAAGRIVARTTELLRRYFDGERVVFDVPLDTSFLTPWERRVTEEVARIGYGEVSTYGDVASRIGWPRAARAVGGVMGRNCYPILVPCHRVLGSDGLGGFGGRLDLKRALLRLEGAPLQPPPRPARPRRAAATGTARRAKERD